MYSVTEQLYVVTTACYQRMRKDRLSRKPNGCESSTRKITQTTSINLDDEKALSLVRTTLIRGPNWVTKCTRPSLEWAVWQG